MEFGIAFKGDLSHKRTLAIARQVEAGGFDYVWFFDSHIIWSDPYTQIAACMQHTDRVRFGPLVTNPKVRDWSVAASIFATLNRMSNGRMDMAVGRGDSSMRVMGKKPANLATLTEFVSAIRTMVSGESYKYDQSPNPVFMDWIASLDSCVRSKSVKGSRRAWRRPNYTTSGSRLVSVVC